MAAVARPGATSRITALGRASSRQRTYAARRKQCRQSLIGRSDPGAQRRARADGIGQGRVEPLQGAAGAGGEVRQLAKQGSPPVSESREGRGPRRTARLSSDRAGAVGWHSGGRTAGASPQGAGVTGRRGVGRAVRCCGVAGWGISIARPRQVGAVKAVAAAGFSGARNACGDSAGAPRACFLPGCGGSGREARGTCFLAPAGWTKDP
jgi:hypothetical protein